MDNGCASLASKILTQRATHQSGDDKVVLRSRANMTRMCSTGTLNWSALRKTQAFIRDSADLPYPRSPYSVMSCDEFEEAAQIINRAGLTPFFDSKLFDPQMCS